MRIVLITAIVVMIGFVDGNPSASKDELQNRIFGLLPFVQKGLCVGSKFKLLSVHMLYSFRDKINNNVLSYLDCATFSCAVPIARCNIPFNLIFELDKLLVVDLIRKFPQVFKVIIIDAK